MDDTEQAGPVSAQDDLEGFFAVLRARDEDLAARGLPAYWKPKGSHRRNKPEAHRDDPWCHNWKRPAADIELVDVPCGWGLCVNACCAVCGRISYGLGPMGCPCDQTNGWKSAYPAGAAQPHPPVKPAGRHRGRIVQARRKAAARDAVTARWRTLGPGPAEAEVQDGDAAGGA